MMLLFMAALIGRLMVRMRGLVCFVAQWGRKGDWRCARQRRNKRRHMFLSTNILRDHTESRSRGRVMVRDGGVVGRLNVVLVR